MRAIHTLLLVVLSFSLSAQSVLGKWKTIDDETGKPKSIVEIYKNGAVYEGKILKLFRGPDEEQDPVCKECDKDDPRYMKKIIGMTIVKDMEMDVDVLDDGTILDPKKGEVYDLPIPQPHCSANMGMRLKLTCSISGAMTNEVKS